MARLQKVVIIVLTKMPPYNITDYFTPCTSIITHINTAIIPCEVLMLISRLYINFEYSKISPVKLVYRVNISEGYRSKLNKTALK